MLLRLLFTNYNIIILNFFILFIKLKGILLAKEDAKTAIFVADVTKKGLDFADVVISRTASASSTWSSKTVRSIIPKDQLVVFNSLIKWRSETSTDIPVTRLL